MIRMQDIEEAIRKVTIGLEKQNRIISDHEKNITAYHEAGHAIVSFLLPTQDDVKEVTIVPRGSARTVIQCINKKKINHIFQN